MKAATLYHVIRSDGRDVLRYGFNTKKQAEQAARKLVDPRQPFTYRVRAKKIC